MGKVVDKAGFGGYNSGVERGGEVGKYAKYYGCFTEEQQDYYNNKLSDKEQLYVDFRGQGYTKSESVKNAGYRSSRPSQVANTIEKKKPMITQLAILIVREKMKQGILEQKKTIDEQTMAKMIATEGDRAIEVLGDSPDEKAKRINFYKTIADGSLKTKKVVQEVDPITGVVIKKRVEEVDDISVRMKAREKLDEILGLKNFNILEKLKVNDITINFVDAGKPEEIQDQRNKVDMNVNEIEVEANVVEEVGDEEQ